MEIDFQDFLSNFSHESSNYNKKLAPPLSITQCWWLCNFFFFYWYKQIVLKKSLKSHLFMLDGGMLSVWSTSMLTSSTSLPTWICSNFFDNDDMINKWRTLKYVQPFQSNMINLFKTLSLHILPASITLLRPFSMLPTLTLFLFFLFFWYYLLNHT